MSFIDVVRHRARVLFRRNTYDRDLTEEFCFHLGQETMQQEAAGALPDDAAARARRRFGNSTYIREETRRAAGLATIDALTQDVRYSLRGLRRTPLFSAVATLTLGLAIGGASSVFSVVNAVLLRALPYPDPARLVLVWGTDRIRGDHSQVSFTDLDDWRHQTRAFAALAAFQGNDEPVLARHGRGAAKRERVGAMQVSDGFFEVLRARPLLGRLLISVDQQPGSASVVVLSYDLWRRSFASDASVVGTDVRLDGQPFTVVGVLRQDVSPLPASLAGRRVDLYRPLAGTYDDTQRSWTWLRGIGRLAPGATLRQAQAELDLVASRQQREHPRTNAGRGARVVAMHDDLTRSLRSPLLLLQAAVLLVLLIACTNIANLLLARATVRRREMAVRSALGAARTRLLRQALTESAVLALIGGAVGACFAAAGVALLTRAGAGVIPELGAARLDVPTLEWTAALAIGSVMIFGLAPAARLTSPNLVGVLPGSGRGASSIGSRLRDALVVVEVALCLVVLVGAGLLTRSYLRVRDVPAGFDAHGVLTGTVSLPDGRYPSAPKRVAFFRDLLDKLGGMRGVAHAGAASVLPESGNFDHTEVKVEGRKYAEGEAPKPDVYRVTPGYFEAMRIPLRAGRTFTADDDDRHPPTAVVNESMARALFPGEDAVGKRVWTGYGQNVRTIVGVVQDVYQYGLESKLTIQLYVPYADNSARTMAVVLRTAGDPGSASLAEALRSTIRRMDAEVVPSDIATMDDVLAKSSAPRRLTTDLFLVFAAAALVLAAAGLYGVIAYAVAQRTNELGIRMALGAGPRSIIALVVGRAFALSGAGIVLGAAIASATSHSISNLLFGVAALDAVTYIASVMLVVAIAAVASAIPARRAARIDLVRAMRPQ